MTRSHQRERMVFITDTLDRVADDRESAVAPEPYAPELIVAQPELPAGPARAPRQPGIRDRFAAWVRRPRREKNKHYPQRFATEFEVSIVDRERRRL